MAISIKDNILTSDEKLKFQRKFGLSLDEVAVLSITKKSYWDFDESFLTILSEAGQLYHINYEHLSDKVEKEINRRFGIDIKLNPYPLEHYEIGSSEVMFPKQFEGVNLYRRNSSGPKPMFNWLLRQFQIRQIPDGILRKEIQAFLDRI